MSSQCTFLSFIDTTKQWQSQFESLLSSCGAITPDSIRTPAHVPRQPDLYCHKARSVFPGKGLRAERAKAGFLRRDRGGGGADRGVSARVHSGNLVCGGNSQSVHSKQGVKPGMMTLACPLKPSVPPSIIGFTVIWSASPSASNSGENGKS